MSNVIVIIKMCYVHNQWYDISCATLYILYKEKFENDVSVQIKIACAYRVSTRNTASLCVLFLNL